MDWLTKQFKPLERRLASLLRKRGKSTADSKDVIQEAFLRVLEYCEQGKELQDPEAFLVRTALNLSRDWHERAHGELYVGTRLEELKLADKSEIPDEIAEADDCLNRLQRVLNGLEPRTREAYYLHRVHGLQYAQIARHFEISVSAVEKHIAKASAALIREALQS